MGLLIFVLLYAISSGIDSLQFTSQFTRSILRHSSDVGNQLQYSSTRIYQLVTVKRPPSMSYAPAVGDVVVGQVEDFAGSLSDPIVEFSVSSI